MLEETQPAVCADLAGAFRHGAEFIEPLVEPVFDMRILIEIPGDARGIGNGGHYLLGLAELHLIGEETRADIFFSQVGIDPEIADNGKILQQSIFLKEAFANAQQYLSARAADADYERRCNFDLS